jgi:hypothetical protein
LLVFVATGRGGSGAMSKLERHTSGIPGPTIIIPCLAACLALAAGCGTEGAPGTIDTVQLKLDFGGGVTLDNVDYVLTGPAMFRRTGTLAVADQPTISATFQNLPAGTGYDVKVQGTATDDLSFCKGEAMFDVATMMNAVVQITLTCSGRASVSADVNVCPTLDSFSVVPSEVYVGGSMQLTAVSHDPDNGPMPLTASWSATSGTLTNLSTTGATFTCTAPGTFRVGVTINDGTPAQKCTDSASVNVVCTPAPSALLMSVGPTRVGAV